MVPYGYSSVELTPLGSWLVSITIVCVVVMLAYHELRIMHEAQIRKPSKFESEAQKLIVGFTEKAFIPAKGQLHFLNEGISAEFERNHKGDVTAQFLRGAATTMPKVLDNWSFRMREPQEVIKIDVQELGDMATSLIGHYVYGVHRSLEFIRFVLLQEYLPPEFVCEKIRKFLEFHEVLIEHFNEISTKGYFQSFLRGTAERQLKELTEIKDNYSKIIADYQPLSLPSIELKKQR